MTSAATLRKHIEAAFADRIPAALSFRHPVTPELLSCGVSEVDVLLGGGLPLGAITEMSGAHSSGRTTLALATLAEITRQGESCAYVDVSDALNPLSAAALGVDLRRLLWIRAGELRTGNHPTGDLGAGKARTRVDVDAPPGFSSHAVTPAKGPAHTDIGSPPGWRHPRDEARNMHRAVGELFQNAHEECVDFTPCCSEVVRRERIRPMVFTPQAIGAQPIRRPRIPNMRQETSWMQLDHALQATDLLLNTGGFRALILDMGDVSPEQVRRVPLATWYRFRLQVEKSQILFLMITRVPCANSCAAVSLHCEQGVIHWQQAAVHSPVHSPSLLSELDYRVNVVRSRAVDPTRKKPAVSSQSSWSSTPSWAR